MRILHLTTRAEWDSALAAGAYRTSTIGATLDEVGFIHASRPEQVAATASRFYADLDDPLVVLVLDTDRLSRAGIRVVEEDGGGELFPHVYAALPVDLVDEVRPAWFGADGALVY